MDAFNVADKRITELKNKLTEVERDKKSAEAALECAERQAEGQQRQLRQTENQLAASKEQIATLKKKLEEAEKTRDQAEQDSYDVGVAEIEEAFRAEVSEVCRNYCLQLWNKAFNQAGIEASSTLRRVESVYYPLDICAPGSTSSKANIASEVVELGKDSPAKVPVSSNSPSKEAQHLGVTEKETDTTKGVAPDAIKPPVAPQDLPKEKEVPPKMEIVLTTLPVPAKRNLKGKAQKPQRQHSPNPLRPQ